MPERYPYEKRHQYPHMMPADVLLWERFLVAFPNAYDTVEYDVKVGSVPEFVSGHEDITMREQSPLYQRKIDVVGYKADQIDIIEIGPRAGTNKLGQVVGYHELYKRDYKPSVEPKKVVLTDTSSVDLEHIAYSMGVLVVVV